MRVLLLFFRGWLALCFVLVYFVIPFYLVAIYPDVPEPVVRAARGLGHGAIKGPPSELGFWYRFFACGAWVGLGLLLVRRFIHGEEGASNQRDRKTEKLSNAMPKQPRRSRH